MGRYPAKDQAGANDATDRKKAMAITHWHQLRIRPRSCPVSGHSHAPALLKGGPITRSDNGHLKFTTPTH